MLIALANSTHSTQIDGKIIIVMSEYIVVYSHLLVVGLSMGLTVHILPSIDASHNFQR